MDDRMQDPANTLAYEGNAALGVCIVFQDVPALLHPWQCEFLPVQM